MLVREPRGAMPVLTFVSMSFLSVSAERMYPSASIHGVWVIVFPLRQISSCREEKSLFYPCFRAQNEKIFSQYQQKESSFQAHQLDQQ